MVPPLRRWVARSAYACGLWHGYGSGCQILYYHRIVEALSGRCLRRGALSTEEFVSQLDFFRRHRKVVPLSDVLLSLQAHIKPPPSWTVLCFDDASRSVFKVVLPELERRGLPFTIGVPTALPDSGRTLWEYEVALVVSALWRRAGKKAFMLLVTDLSERVGKPGSATVRKTEEFGVEFAVDEIKTMIRGVPEEIRYGILQECAAHWGVDLAREGEEHDEFQVMTWSELGEAVARGAGLAAHGHFHHPHRDGMSDQVRESEIRAPRETLERKMGLIADTFIWPEGAVSQRSRECATSAGYRCLLTTSPGFVHAGTSLHDVPRNSGEWSIAQVLWNTRGLT